MQLLLLDVGLEDVLLLDAGALGEDSLTGLGGAEGVLWSGKEREGERGREREKERERERDKERDRDGGR